jgi:hypothetical protein
VDAINDCGRALRPEYGFPDKKCPAESPLAALDVPAPSDTKPAAPTVEAGDQKTSAR